MSFLHSVVKKDKSVRSQARRGSEPSCYHQVVHKLKGHPTYAQCSDREVTELVDRLINPEMLLQYFDLAPEEQQGAGATGGAEVDMLPVQLVLKWSQHHEDPDNIESILLDEYGPLRAYLVIGELILEWDWTSLITPHGKPIQVKPQARVVPDVEEARCNPIELSMFKNKVLAKVAKYNKVYYFHVIQRNSHDFVCSILEIMKLPPPQPLENKLKKYFDFLENAKSSNVPDKFKSHTNLDQYVIEYAKDFSEIDMEYIMVHYFMFHFVSRLKEENFHKWECAEPYCKMHLLKAKIDPKQFKIHNFRTIKYKFRGSNSEDSMVRPIL